MTCRASTSTTTCAGTQTGAQLTYDNQDQLSAWQNAPSSPTTTTGDLYDGEGHRVEQQATSGGSTTTTAYVGNLEEVATTGGTTTATTYYYASGQRIAEAVNGVFSYLGNDTLGSATVALTATGATQAAQLYAPYGSSRYSSGTLPGSYGFTGQRADATTGLDYYIARSYDPPAGQFTSADITLPGGGYDA
jgi:RHS repeat-associated protein